MRDRRLRCKTEQEKIMAINSITGIGNDPVLANKKASESKQSHSDQPLIKEDKTVPPIAKPVTITYIKAGVLVTEQMDPDGLKVQQFPGNNVVEFYEKLKEASAEKPVAFSGLSEKTDIEL